MSKSSANSNVQPVGHLPATSEAKVGEIVSADVAKQIELQPILAGLPADISSLKVLSKNLHQAVGETVYELGRVLIALRHKCEHGEFIDHVEGMGMSRSWAHTLMQHVHRCAELKVITKGKLDFDLVNKLGIKKATVFVNHLLEAPDELPSTKKEARAQVDAYSAMSYRQMREELSKKDKEIEKRARVIETGKTEVKDLETQLDSYRRSDDDAVRRACLRLQEQQLESLNEFENTLQKHIPGGDKRTLSSEERIHLNSTVEFLHQLHGSIREFLFGHFPQISESSAADLAAASKLVRQTAGAPPSLESKPDFLGRVLDAVESEQDQEEDEPAPARKSRNGRKH